MNELQDLLDAGLAHHAEYGGELANHLPMALTALHALGASPARLSEFAERYGRQLAPAAPHAAWPAGDAWTSRLGDGSAYAVYRDLFRQWLGHERPEQLLPQVLPRLMQGCGAAAFHGMIRAAYAVQAKHLGELAEGLALWACRWLPLGPLPEVVDSVGDPEAVLGRLRMGSSRAGLIVLRMRDALADPTLAPQVARLMVDERTLPQLSVLAAHAYAASGNFTVLHLLTSAHALRELLPFLDTGPDQAVAVRHYWQAFAVAVVAARIARREPAPLLPWDEIGARAIASSDEHVIKLVHSCREQAKVFGGVSWQYAASRGVEREAASRGVEREAAPRGGRRSAARKGRQS